MERRAHGSSRRELARPAAGRLKSKNEVTKEQHGEFFRYVAQSFDEPRYTIHLPADAPVSIRSLFYVPQSHMEKWGMARQDGGVHLYCRKVLIQSRCDKVGTPKAPTVGSPVDGATVASIII